ncbi:MAG: hypothetical protein ACI4W6_05390 [Acutalibacteraceae bacterium]
MDQFIEFFTKIYQSICSIVLKAIQTIQGLVSSITDAVENDPTDAAE